MRGLWASPHPLFQLEINEPGGKPSSLYVGGSVKFGRRAKLFWQNEDFFLEVRFDKFLQKV